MNVLRLKEVLKEKGISGKGLSEKVGVTQATISNISNGNHFPKPDLLLQIAETLDVDVKDLFNSTKTNKDPKAEMQSIINQLETLKAKL
ncbi:helix-turn-helix transcriptional regulator [Polaribacter batillariae]|uniref:Helix-turn-helix transcriptional regulator n=1 Tax=Polaribacter batillariae TaxID=2808900 RepID=A0ABX7ST33_9FLAO|nr:helix-turn-helix transcriptional regulator [Polaribacter batillariae]QTD37047.1 helix-turn-helix transcriptional regulator [Polaribacter batillariae]